MEYSKKIRLFAGVILVYGICRLYGILPSINIFINDPFYVNTLITKNLNRYLFYKILIHMNLNLFLILLTSFGYVICSLCMFNQKKKVIRWIIYLSSFGLCYVIIETLIICRHISLERLNDIFSKRGFWLMSIGFLFYCRHILFYIYSIITAQKLLGEK